jgi:predicted RNase H-like nuclease (RuvC/YqgF family)
VSDERFNMGEDPMTMEELTERVVELSDRVARLEALVEEFRKTREELREEIWRVDAKMDRQFWLWVSTIAAAFVLRVLGLV